MVNIKDYSDAKVAAPSISKLTDYKVEAWQEGNSQLDSANVLRDIIAIAVSLTILIVAGFGIYNIMNMTVNEKIKEIAILKAMGFNGKDVIEIFLTTIGGHWLYWRIDRLRAGKHYRQDCRQRPF
jgi:lipoprotein-releasing system permease protein